MFDTSIEERKGQLYFFAEDRDGAIVAVTVGFIPNRVELTGCFAIPDGPIQIIHDLEPGTEREVVWCPYKEGNMRVAAIAPFEHTNMGFSPRLPGKWVNWTDPDVAVCRTQKQWANFVQEWEDLAEEDVK